MAGAAASGDKMATMEIASEKWSRRFKRCLFCCSQVSNANLAQTPAILVEEGAEGQAQNAGELAAEEQIKLEDLDHLLNDIKDKIQRLSTAAASSSSSSSSKLPSLITRTKGIISTYMSSFPNDVQKEGGAWLKILVTRALGGAGVVHWLGLGLSLIAWTLDNFDQTAQNHDDCILILQRSVFLLSNSKQIWEASSKDDINTIETLQHTVSKAFACAIVCTSYLNNVYFLRFLKAPTAKAAIASLKEDLGSAVEVLDLRLSTLTLLHTAPKIEPQCADSDDDDDDDDDDDSVGAAVLGAKEKAMEYLKEDLDNTKALCLHGMGGIGKSTLGLSIFRSFQSMKSYRYCKVELSFGIKDEQLHTIQNEILEKACCTKGNVSNPREGKDKLKEELKKTNGPIFLYLDNVLESRHLGKLLPKASCFPRGSRILVTTRNESVHSSVLDDLNLESSKLIEVCKWEEELARKFLRKQIFRGRNKEVGGSYPGELEKRVLALCDGLPLALKVVGRYIRNDGRDPMHPQVWKDVEKAMKQANSLDGSAEDELYDRLMFSLKVLDKDHKRAFLDIVAFVIDYSERYSREDVERMVGGHRYLEGLRKRALVQIKSRVEGKECVNVHDILKEMGKKIVAEDKDEVRITSQDELQKKSGYLANVVALKKVLVQAHQLKQMPRLRILDNVCIVGECEETKLDHLLVVSGVGCGMNCITFSSKLKALSWRPFARNPKLNLEVLKICHELEILGLTNVNVLENMDVIQTMTCLKELTLRCESLQCLPVVNLPELKKLDLSHCSNLQSLPDGISNVETEGAGFVLLQ